jgi:hypothetical protein
MILIYHASARLAAIHFNNYSKIISGPLLLDSPCNSSITTVAISLYCCAIAVSAKALAQQYRDIATVVIDELQGLSSNSGPEIIFE